MENRIKILNQQAHKSNVLYLMNRDQRIYQNHSVQLGYNLSYQTKSRFFIGFDFPNVRMNERQKDFIFEGLSELRTDAKNLDIPTYLINDLDCFVTDFKIDCIILDFSPLREIKLRDKKILKMCESNKMALYLCDSHNIVPCWMLSVYKRTGKAVRTDLYKLYDQFATDFNELTSHKYNKKHDKTSDKAEDTTISMDKISESKYLDLLDLVINKSKSNIDFIGGYTQGIKAMNDFFENRYDIYSEQRNNSDVNALTGLSPWLHAGQISAQFVILEAHKRFEYSDKLYTFCAEMFVWRETADHFVFHEPNYDNLKGALGWARETLKTHTVDQRPVIYSEDELRHAKTKDNLWNAAQNELVISGKMHGYVRMYWAKRILEWTKTPEEALKIALEFNDEYSLDGCDCNGYLGVMWSICGSMDRAFKERPVFGKIRFMRAFKSPGYISKWSNAKKLNKK